jgi:photosystem II stability/assembly factor-like uncharacterized protein
MIRRAALLVLIATLLLGGLYLALPREQAEVPVALPDDVRRPSEWGWLQRTYPHFQADPGAYRAATQQAQALRAAAKTDPFGAWTLSGPTNVGGRVVDVAFDPKTPSTIYAAAATGGVFKSIDSGQTWRPIFDAQPILSIGDLAVAPSDPQTLYVGTGEANGGHNNFAGAGLYKSTDGGATWTFLGLERTVSIGRIRVHPSNPDRVYVAAAGSYFSPNPERGVYRTTDGGQTWERVLFVDDETGAIDLIQRPDDPDVLLAATWQRVRTYESARLSGPGSGIYRSTDGGDSWQRLGPEHGLPSRPAGRIGLALSRSQPDVMAALYTDGTNYLGLYGSTDGGDSWQNIDPDREVAQGTGGFSWYFGQVRLHPTDPDRLYAMDVQYMDSDDGGDTWSFQVGTHVDHHALAFHPQHPDVMVNGNDGGIALSDDGGRTWTPVADLPVTQFYEIGLDPTNPERRYGGTQDNGTLRTTTGDIDDWQRILGGDGFYVIVDPTNPDVLYAESQFGNLVKIADGALRSATTGIPADEPRNWSTPVVMDPSDPQTLYYGTDQIWRTQDGAQTWTAISPDLTKDLATSLLGTVTSIAVAPTDPDVLFAGTDDGNVWTTTDGGQAWQNVTGDLPTRWVTRLAIDPTTPRAAYVTFSGLKWTDPQPHVFRTTDGGQTWQDISSNLPDAPVNAFAVDPSYPDVLYLGSDVGAFVSLDAGASWQPLGTGLPAVSVYDLKVFDDGTERFLVAGTHGRSMYTLDLPDFDKATAADDRPDQPALTLATPFPNPFSERTTLHFTLPDRAPVRLAIYDVLGRRVMMMLDRSAASGTHRITWDGTDATGRRVAAGTYVARLEASVGTDTATRSVLLRVAR